MIIFLYGPENFLARRRLEEIVGKYKAKHQSGLNFQIFDAEAEEDFFEPLKNFFRSVSMFPEKKLAVLKNAVQAKRESGGLVSFLTDEKLAGNEENFLVVFEGGAVDKKSDFFKALNRRGVKSEEFGKLPPVRFKEWLKEEITKKGGEINDRVLNELSVIFDGNLWLASNELDKLLAFSKTITAEAIEALLASSLKLNIFETVEAISRGDKKKAWKFLHEHLNQGEDLNYLVSMISYQFRNLVLVEDLRSRGLNKPAIVKKSGLHPFVVEKSLNQLVRVDRKYLRKIYGLLNDLEIESKTGRTDPQTAIDLLVAQA